MRHLGTYPYRSNRFTRHPSRDGGGLAHAQASELLSSFTARQLMRLAFGVDVSQVGLDEMREYPELVPACGELIQLRGCMPVYELTVQAGRACTYR